MTTALLLDYEALGDELVPCVHLRRDDRTVMASLELQRPVVVTYRGPDLRAVRLVDARAT